LDVAPCQSDTDYRCIGVTVCLPLQYINDVSFCKLTLQSIFFFHGLTALVGPGIFISEASCSHSMTHTHTYTHTVWPLWTSDQSVAEPSNVTSHNTRRPMEPAIPQASGLNTPYTALPPGPALHTHSSVEWSIIYLFIYLVWCDSPQWARASTRFRDLTTTHHSL
jgi:hypothetical protein